MTRWISIPIAAALAVAPALGESDEGPLTGGIDVGYRDASVDGNVDKYREDFNLEDGAFRLFGLDLTFRPVEPGLFDTLQVSASGIGGEPYQSADLRMRKAGRYDLRLGFRSSEFFYRDAGYFFSGIGDLHTWDAKRTFHDVALRVEAARWLTLRFGADRAEREGGSQTSRYLQMDGFVLDRPLDQTASTWSVGADFHVEWIDLTVERRLVDRENRRLLRTSSNGGLEPGGGTLDAYEVLHVQDAEAPLTRVAVSGHPSERLRFSAGYARIDAEVASDVDGSWNGLDYEDGALPPEPYSTTLVNRGRIDRTYELWDADVTLGLGSRADLTVDWSRRSWDQDGTIDSLERQSGGKEAGDYVLQGEVRNALELETTGATVRWRATEAVTLSLGAGVQTRDADFQLSGPAVETERRIWRGGLRVRPGRGLDLRLSYESGSDDDPYTQVAPSDIDRASVRVRYTPNEKLRFDVRFRDERRENLRSYPLGNPTDNTPPATEVSAARFDVTSWGASATWSGTAIDASAGYDRTEIESDADIVYVTGFTLVPTFDIFTALDRTGYLAEQDTIHGSVRAQLGRAWSAGAQVSITSSDGTFPVDWMRYGADVKRAFGNGLYARVMVERYELDETNPYAGDPAVPTPDVNDYEADLWTVALGYRF